MEDLVRPSAAIMLAMYDEHISLKPGYLLTTLPSQAIVSFSAPVTGDLASSRSRPIDHRACMLVAMYAAALVETHSAMDRRNRRSSKEGKFVKVCVFSRYDDALDRLGVVSDSKMARNCVSSVYGIDNELGITPPKRPAVSVASKMMRRTISPRYRPVVMYSKGWKSGRA